VVKIKDLLYEFLRDTYNKDKFEIIGCTEFYKLWMNLI